MNSKTLYESLIQFCQENSRICPMPIYWSGLYELLPNKRQGEFGWEPPLPLILAAWSVTLDLEKSVRFRKHLEWAFQQKIIDKVDSFLRGLSADKWHQS